MNRWHVLKFALYIHVGCAVVYATESSSYCGYQHTDDYMQETNATSIDEFPWVAALIYKYVKDGTKALLCSGALINRRYVLTAAQCLTQPRASVLVAVRLGEYSTKNKTDCVVNTRFDEPDCTEARDFGIEEKILYPGYNRRTRANDVALLRLDTVLNEFSDYIRPICVFPRGAHSAKQGDSLAISGWGRQFHDSTPAEIKKKIQAIVTANEECAKQFPEFNVTGNQMCTTDSPTNSEFTCQGDAGAPVMFVQGAVPQWHLEGISSWGGQCGFQRPQVHTRISSYVEWIEENIREDN